MKSGLIQKIYKTVHRNKKTVYQIADEIGLSSNSLYKWALEGKSGTNLPLKWLVPLMKAAGDYSILKYIAALCGFILVKIPRIAISKKDAFELREEYQEVTSKAQSSLKNFFDKPDPKNYAEVQQALQEVMEKSASAQKYTKKVYDGQFEMEL